MGFESDLLKGNNLRHTIGYADDDFFFPNSTNAL